MLTRRQFLEQGVSAGTLLATAAQFGQPADDVGVGRGPYIQTSGRIHAKIGRIKSVIRRDETVLRHGGNGDNWHMSWGSNDRQYVGLCDGFGFSDQFTAMYNTRMLTIEGGPEYVKFHDLPTYPLLGFPSQRTTDTRYYGFGTLAVDDHVYQFLSTLNRTVSSGEMDDPSEIGNSDQLRFVGVKGIYSPDNGRTWRNQDGATPVVWENSVNRSRKTMVFFEESQDAFSLLTVLQMGKNYEHNRDGYVYVYAPNGNTDGTMNELVMFRVPKGRILDRTRYEFFAGFQSGQHATWSTDIDARAPVCIFPRGWVNKFWHPYAWQPSVVYNAPQRVYMMTNWGMGRGADIDSFSGVEVRDLWFARPSYLGLWIAANPWGPWQQIHEETAWLPGNDRSARAYQPQIAPKWVAADGKSFWLVWSDYQVKGGKQELRRANETYTAKGYDNLQPSDWEQLSRNARKFMPYYAFNAQRVDLVV